MNAFLCLTQTISTCTGAWSIPCKVNDVQYHSEWGISRFCCKSKAACDPVSSAFSLRPRNLQVEEKRRHLLRLWLSPKEGWELPECYSERYGSTKVGDRGGIWIPGSQPHVPVDARSGL